MIVPVRCVTCGKVIADKWRYFERRVAELEMAGEGAGARARVLDELGLVRYCCRRHMLGHVDLIDRI